MTAGKSVPLASLRIASNCIVSVMEMRTITGSPGQDAGFILKQINPCREAMPGIHDYPCGDSVPLIFEILREADL